MVHPYKTESFNTCYLLTYHYQTHIILLSDVETIWWFSPTTYIGLRNVIHCKQPKDIIMKPSMACSISSRYIPSDPEFIFNYFDNLPSDDLRVTSMVTSTNISARTNIPQQTTTTVFQIKPVLVHSILLPMLHLTQPLLVIFPPTQLYIHNT